MKLIKTLWFQPNKPRLMMLILFTALFTAGCVMPVLPSTDDGAINAALSVVIDDEDQVAVVDINPTINVRLEPTFAAEVLGVLNAGDEVQILETDATGAWHRVRTLGPGVQIGEADTSGTLVGWIFIEVVAQDGLSAPDVATADTTEAVASAQTDASDSAAGDTSTTEVGADATIIATTEIVLAPTPTFTPPATPTFTPPPTVPPAPPTPTPPSVPLVITEPENMNIRWGPSTEYAVAAIVTQGSTFQIVAYSPDGAWYQIIVPEISEPVWIYSGLTRIVGPTAGLRRLTEDEIPPAFRIVTATFTPVTGSVAPAATPTFTPPPTVYYTPSPTFTPPIYPTPTFTPPPQVAAPDAPAAPAVQAASAPVVSAPPPSGGGFFGYGIQAHLLGSDAGRAIEATNDIGFGWLKQQVQWKLYERSQGSVNLGSLQGIVAGAQSRGINVLFSVVGAPDWAREANFDGSVDGPPADPQSFANFVGRMAGTFCGSGLKAIEIWNEQNLHYEWGNRPLDPVEYMNLLRPAYASIKAACPSMLVISGALTPAGDNGGLARDDFAYLEAMYQNGLANYADGIGAHPSGYNVPPSVGWQSACSAIQQNGNIFNGACDNPHHSWSFRGTMEGYRNIMVVYGDSNKRVWPTEFGWAAGGALDPRYKYADDNSYDEQARWTVEAYNMMRTWGWVGPAFLWNLNFRVVADGTEKAQWGIVRNDYSPLPVYNALKSMPKN